MNILFYNSNDKKISFRESTKAISNPLIGWAPLANVKSYPQPHTLVYALLLWADLEQKKGEFRWEEFEKKNNFDYWKKKNVKIIIRFHMDEPSNNRLIDIPEWLHNEMGENKGTYYDNGKLIGFSPNYNDEYLVNEHNRVIEALGQRYNKDKNIAHIAIGSIGHWGEFHTYMAGLDKFPENKVCNKYIESYINSFDSDKLVIRRPIELAKINNFGLYNDMFGDIESLRNKDWGLLKAIEEGYIDGLNQKQPDMKNFWKKSVSGGEFANGDAKRYLKNDTIKETLEQAKILHTSWLGPCMPANLELGCDVQNNIDKLSKTLGYRFYLKNIVYNTNILSGKDLTMKFEVINRGIAPFYKNWPLKLYIKDGENIIIHEETLFNIVNKWNLGANLFEVKLKIPENLNSKETYHMYFKISNPDNESEKIQFANIEDNIEFKLFNFTVNK